MKFISVCSGIEAASVAWRPLGWSAVAFSEIEPFPCSVLAHHYPTVPNRGDMTKFEDWPDDSVDLLCGGTPCQSFSVAGLRAGLADPRGDLMLTFGAIAARHRPKWLVWENVPGVLSSNGGRDFGAFLRLLGLVGYGFAYRVLDAQHFGVPQRRRRVFVVGCLGDWRSAAAVLFERHSLSGHPAPRRESREGTAGRVAPCIDASFGRLQGASGQDANHGHGHLIPERERALTTSNQRIDAETETFVISHALRGEGFDASEDGTGRGRGRGTPIVPVGFMPARTFGADGGIDEHFAPRDVCDALHTSSGNGNKAPLVTAFPAFMSGTQSAKTSDLSPALGAENQTAMQSGMQVRRLTPRECERLQGFPDDYTAVPHRGKPAADGPRYKALGNSWAVPCARWIGERINAVEQITAPQELEPA